MEASTNTKHLVLVHKRDDEGTILIDYLTGSIVTEIDERPDWAEGLTNALPRERETYYKTRLGEDYSGTDGFKHPTAIAFEDLGWLGVGGEGELVEIDADREFRQEVVKEFLAIDEETGDVAEGSAWKTVAEAETALDTERTPEEAAEIFDELETNMGGEPSGVHHADKKFSAG